jgi:hypothetical protein
MMLVLVLMLLTQCLAKLPELRPLMGWGINLAPVSGRPAV